MTETKSQQYLTRHKSWLGVDDLTKQWVIWISRPMTHGKNDIGLMRMEHNGLYCLYGLVSWHSSYLRCPRQGFSMILLNYQILRICIMHSTWSRHISTDKLNTLAMHFRIEQCMLHYLETNITKKAYSWNQFDFSAFLFGCWYCFRGYTAWTNWSTVRS